MKPVRVVSLLPAATEIVCGLGLEAALVGRSHVCDYPRSILGLPSCTASKAGGDGGSREIDEAVKSLAKEGAPLFELDADKLRELRPDVILTQAQCDVCAVALDEVERAVADWKDAKPTIVSIAPARFSELWETIFEVAEALDVAEAGGSLIKHLKGRVVDVIERACVSESKPSVACLEWLDPLMAAGNWIPDLVDLAGGNNLFGEAGKHSPWMEWGDLAAADPGVIVLMACGFGLEKMRVETAALSGKTEWQTLGAVRNGRVYVTDGSGYFNRPGPRLVDSLEMLAAMIHPDVFPSKFEGEAWERL